MANVKPGDIKYKDLNGDKKIDQYDRTYIGDPYIPQIVYGFGLSAKYKRWDFSVYFQGVSKVSIYMNDIHPFGVYHKNVLGFVAKDYWSESNPNPNAALSAPLSHRRPRQYGGALLLLAARRCIPAPEKPRNRVLVQVDAGLPFRRQPTYVHSVQTLGP